ncbi:MAG: choice-of-anchor D domain-containing protein, partial [Ignavibacteriaceae bacterium]
MKFSKVIFSLILLFVPDLLFAQAPNFDWVRQGGYYSSSNYSDNVAVDKSGNIFVTGYLDSTIDFGGDYVLNSFGSSDVFLAKYDSEGNILWAKHAGSKSYDYGYSVAVDKDGNIYVTGIYSDSANFDTNILYTGGGEDVFLAKYSTSGQLLWIRHGGGEYDDYSNDVTTDKQGNVIITGGYEYSASFNSAYLNGPGINNIFIVKYDPQGNILWAKNGGGNGYNIGNSIATDSQNDILIAGAISDTVTFDSDNIFSFGYSDAMIAKYDPSGNLIWIKHAGGSENYNYAEDISLDRNDNIYMTGYFTGIVFFGDIQASSHTSTDIFTAKYDINGNPLWVNRDSYYGYNYGGSITSDPAGNVTVTGTAYSPGYVPPPKNPGNKLNPDFKRSQRINTKAFKPSKVTSEDQYLYIVRYNNDGQKMWDKAIYSSCDGGIANAPNGDLILTGDFYDQVYFDSLSVTSLGYPDIYVARIPSPKISISSKSAAFGFKSLSDTTHYIAIGDTASKYIEFKNSGKAILHIFNTTLISPKNDFSLDPLSLPDSLFTNQKKYLHVNYTAKALSSNGAIQITSDASTSPDTIKLSGYGAPVPLVYQSDSLNFGNADVKDTSGKTLKITNNGTFTVKLLGEILSNQTDFISGVFNGTVPDSIRPNSSNNYIVKFNPQTPGIKSGRLILNSNSSHYQDTIYLSGTGILRTLTFSKKQLDYRNVDVGDSSTNSINITNSGTVDIIFSNKNLTNKTDYHLSEISVPDTISPGKSKVYNIKFHPLSSGIKAGKLILSSNSKSSPDTINLAGTGIIRAITFSSRQINYGNVDVQDTMETNLKITNSGNIVVKLLSENLTDPTDFISGIFNGSVPDSIMPGASNNYIIKFSPQSTGIKTGKLILLSSSKTSPDTINLTGTGIVRAIAFSSKQLNYGSVDVGDSVGKSVTVTNNGTIDIIFSNKNLTNQTEFQLSETSLPDTIHPGKFKSYNIVFNPKSSGIKTGKLIFSSNSLSSPDTITLTGTGIVRSLTFSSRQVNYGNVDVNGWLNKTITITNSGSVDIIFSNKILTEQNDFTLMSSSVPDTIHSLKSKDYTVKFNPLSEGIKTGKLILTSNSKTSPDTVNLAGTGIKRALTFSTREINFGNVDVGNSLTQNITITNNGTVNIIFSKKTLTNQTDFNLSGLSVSDTIQPGKSKDFNFGFIPNSAGNKTGKLIFTSNSQSSPDTVNLLGTGIVRALSFSDKKINFGNVDVNGWLEKSITLTNNGTVDIIISGKNLTNKTDFTLMNASMPDTINPLKSRNYLIKFNPVSPGIKSGLFIFTSNSKTSPDTVELNGNGIQRALTFSTREINFGNTDVGSLLKDSVIVTNNGTVDIIFSNKTLTDQTNFSLTELSVPDTILPGKSKVYNFKFNPESPGIKTGKLIFSGNSESSPDTVGLIGTGVIRNLAFSIRKINYGNVDVGGELEKTLTISNNGTVDIIFSKILLADQINFSIINEIVPDTIRINNSKTYSIRFIPKTAEIKTSGLIFVSNSKSSPDTVSLTGTGIFRTVTFSTRQLDYGNIGVGSSLQKSITITNNGSADIIFSNKLLTNKTDFGLLDSSVPDTLHPEISRQYRINFNPKSPGNKTGEIIFISNSESGADTLTLTGTGTSAVMSLSSNQIDYGSVDINSDSISTLKISNTGTGSLIISKYSVTGANS